MTRSIGAALEAHYQSPVTTLAFCVHIILARWQPRIIDITKANPGVVTTRWNHGLVTGDSIKIVGVEGMTQVNEQFFTITVLSPNTFSLGVDTSSYSTYVKGSWYGTARKVLGFTKHVRDITFNNVVYKSSYGADGTTIATGDDLSLASRDVSVLIDSVAIKTEDLERGMYSGAEAETFEVNYADLSQGRLLLEYGRVGDITIQDQVWLAESLSLGNLLHQNTGPQVSVLCRAQLGNRITDPYDDRFGCKVRLNPPIWLASTAYTVTQARDAGLGSIVKPTTFNGRHYKCTTAGTSGASEPSWNTVIGSTTNDNTVVWTAIDARTKEGAITSVVDTRTFSEAGRLEAQGWWTHGLLTFLTGANAGWSSEIKSYLFDAIPTFQQVESNDTTTGTSGLFPRIPRSGVLAGDTLLMHILIRNQTTTADTPSGWTLLSGPVNIGTTGRAYVFGKVSNGTESVTQTVTFSSDAAILKMGRIWRFRGATGVTLDGAVFANSQSTDNTIEGPTLTSSANNRLGLAFVSATNDVTGVVAFAGATGGTWVNLGSAATTVGDDAMMQCQSVDMAAPGTVSGGSYTISSAEDWAVQALILPVGTVKFTLRDKPFFDMAIGDTFEIEVGCDKRFLETCRDKFDNVYNFRGEPWLPGFNKALLYPDSR